MIGALESQALVIYQITIAFAVILALSWVVYEITERKPSKKSRKSRIFACGMDQGPSELNVPSTNYYEQLNNFLQTERLSRLHSGRLSDYISWILIGMVFVITMLVVLW